MEKLKKVNWILLVLITMGLRSVYSADLAQSLVIISFSSLYGFKLYLDQYKIQEIDKDVRKKLEEVQSTVAGLAMKNAAKPNQMQQEINKRFF